MQTLYPPINDATAFIQAALDSGSVHLSKGLWNISSRLFPRNNIQLWGERGTLINLGGNITAFECNGIENFSIHDLEIYSNGLNYMWPPALSDTGQIGIHINNCKNFEVSNVHTHNLSGHGFKLESSPDYVYDCGKLIGIGARNCFYGLRTLNGGEYIQINNSNFSLCVFGILIESGNVLVSNSKMTHCSIGIKVSDGTNPGHGIFSACESNHNYYNLTTANLSVGETFVGCHFLGNQPNGNGGYIQIYNSRGVILSSGQIGSSILITGGTLEGKCLLEGNLIRDDISGFQNPDDPRGLLLCKNNFTTDGMWSHNN